MSSILLMHFGRVTDDPDEVAFTAEIFADGVFVAELTEADDFHSFAGPTNNVEIRVTTFNETRAAAAGAKWFSIFAE